MNSLSTFNFIKAQVESIADEAKNDFNITTYLDNTITYYISFGMMSCVQFDIMALCEKYLKVLNNTPNEANQQNLDKAVSLYGNFRHELDKTKKKYPFTRWYNPNEETGNTIREDKEKIKEIELKNKFDKFKLLSLGLLDKSSPFSKVPSDTVSEIKHFII